MVRGQQKKLQTQKNKYEARNNVPVKCADCHTVFDKMNSFYRHNCPGYPDSTKAEPDATKAEPEPAPAAAPAPVKRARATKNAPAAVPAPAAAPAPVKRPRATKSAPSAAPAAAPTPVKRARATKSAPAAAPAPDLQEEKAQAPLGDDDKEESAPPAKPTPIVMSLRDKKTEPAAAQASEPLVKIRCTKTTPLRTPVVKSLPATKHAPAAKAKSGSGSATTATATDSDSDRDEKWAKILGSPLSKRDVKMSKRGAPQKLVFDYPRASGAKDDQAKSDLRDQPGEFRIPVLGGYVAIKRVPASAPVPHGPHELRFPKRFGGDLFDDQEFAVGESASEATEESATEESASASED